MTPRVPFLDLRRELEFMSDDLNHALHAVMKKGTLILGSQVERLEHELAQRHHRKHAVAVASGTDALELIFQSLGLSPGSKIITTTLAPPPVLAAIVGSGFRPLAVDVRSSDLSMDPDQVTIVDDPDVGAVLAIDLYGRLADHETMARICEERSWHLVEDASQAVLAQRHGDPVGTHASAAALSFYPTKNLGALGDGGAILTDDEELALHCRRQRDYGRSSVHDMASVGRNSRLDELQAAFLLAKLPYLDDWIDKRRRLASEYRIHLVDHPFQPLPEITGSVDHLFVVRTDHRDERRLWLLDQGIGTAIHYPIPLHRQPAWPSEAPSENLAHTEDACRRLISLPLYPFLGDDEFDIILRTLTQMRDVAPSPP